MKKLIITLFSLFLLLFVTAANAQSATDKSKSKDEFWGTPKTQRGASADAVGARSDALDSRFNHYETGKRGAFKLKNYNSKKLKEMEKREKKILKEHKRQQKKRARRNRKSLF